MSRIFKVIKSAGLVIFVCFISIVAFQYYQVKIYDFPAPQPFSGSKLYNPYAASYPWLKANFHAHSKSWLGLTNGHQNGDAVIDKYLKLGYDVAGLSDYHRLNNSIDRRNNLAIPVYEHGMNIHKQHHLAIGARDVSFADVFLWQNNHIKQSIMDRMSSNAPVVCLNHPGFRDGHTEQEIGKLSGYTCLEVLNNTHNYTSFWDAALSSGRPVWLLANDDSHDIIKDNVAINWTLVSSAPNEEAILNSLASGSTIGIHRDVMFKDPDSLKSWTLSHKGDIVNQVFTRDSTMTIVLTSKVPSIELFGQNGVSLKTVHNSDWITYTFKPGDHYARAEINTGSFHAFLNPIIRYDGTAIPRNAKVATIDFRRTFALRFGIVIAYITLLCVLFPEGLRRILHGTSYKSSRYEQVSY